MMDEQGLERLKANAEAKIAANVNPDDARQCIEEIEQARLRLLGLGRLPPLHLSPEAKVCFLSFCPAGSIENRLDGKWFAEGIAEVWNWQGEERDQHSIFTTLEPGDLIILKKQQKLYVTVRLFGFGIVKGIKEDGQTDDGFPKRSLYVDWSDQIHQLDVDIHCSKTVDMKTQEELLESMPEEFFIWLNWQRDK